jgi:hydroxymethylglutaryl-CoA reductase (NADPH)
LIFRIKLKDMDAIQNIKNLEMKMSQQQIKAHKHTDVNPILDIHRSSVDIQKEMPVISGITEIDRTHSLRGNIENHIGYAQIPLGIAGPLLIHGKNHSRKYQIPLATTEGTLVASYSRGMKACLLSGGVTSICIEDTLERAPYFQFKDIRTAISFKNWVEAYFELLQEQVKKTSRFCRLVSLRFNQEANGVTVHFEYSTGDAAGQNMVTIATDAICKYILAYFPDKPTRWYIESNASGDKKCTLRSLYNSRGKKVIAEVRLPRAVVSSVLKTTPEHMCQYFLNSTMAGLSTGTVGNIGHVANGLTALYIACGQDVACVSESSVGILRMEITEEDELYVALTLPALVVGTVGGGTQLATQKEALNLLDCNGSDKAQQFAEICCATALAGELSIAAAIAEDHFTNAHKSLGRKK